VKRNNGLNVQSVLRAFIRLDTEAGIVLAGETDEIGHRILRGFADAAARSSSDSVVAGF
jgi:hypothetical protein